MVLQDGAQNYIIVDETSLLNHQHIFRKKYKFAIDNSKVGVYYLHQESKGALSETLGALFFIFK